MPDKSRHVVEAIPGRTKSVTCRMFPTTVGLDQQETCKGFHLQKPQCSPDAPHSCPATLWQRWPPGRPIGCRLDDQSSIARFGNGRKEEADALDDSRGSAGPLGAWPGQLVHDGRVHSPAPG